jgi:hypothetical protein
LDFPLFKEYEFFLVIGCIVTDDVLFSPYAAVKEDLEYLRQHPFVKKETKIHGFVFDVQTGLLNPVS